jgi:hypothetical protein
MLDSLILKMTSSIEAHHGSASPFMVVKKPFLEGQRYPGSESPVDSPIPEVKSRLPPCSISSQS